MNNDWLKSGRQEQLDMAAVWTIVLNEPSAASKTVKKYTAWGIPDAVVQELSALVTAAKNILETSKNEETRTKVVDRQVTSAFEALTAKMREVKRKNFYVPPLTEADLVSLGLKVPDTHNTKAGSPSAEFQARFFYRDPRQIGVILECISGNPADPANKEFRYYYVIVPHGAPLPANPEETWRSFSSKRKRESMDDFEYGDSGNTLCVAVGAENGKKKGPWGPMTTVIIP